MRDAAANIVEMKPATTQTTTSSDGGIKQVIREQNIRELTRMALDIAEGKKVPIGLLYCVARSLEDRCRCPEGSEWCRCGNGFEVGDATPM